MSDRDHAVTARTLLERIGLPAVQADDVALVVTALRDAERAGLRKAEALARQYESVVESARQVDGIYAAYQAVPELFCRALDGLTAALRDVTPTPDAGAEREATA